MFAQCVYIISEIRSNYNPVRACVCATAGGGCYTGTVCLYYCRPTTFEKFETLRNDDAIFFTCKFGRIAICVHRPRQKDFEERSFSLASLSFSVRRALSEKKPKRSVCIYRTIHYYYLHNDVTREECVPIATLVFLFGTAVYTHIMGR